MTMALTFDPVTDDLVAVQADGVLTLTIDTPEQNNRITPNALAKLEQIARGLVTDSAVNAIVLTGSGSEHFSTGLLNPVLRAAYSKEQVIALVRMANRAFDALAAAPQISIAAINAPLRAGGAELALACDIRIAADTATMFLPEAAWGGFPGAGGPMRLAAIVGRGKALQLIGTGETIDAAEMHRLGLVEEVVPASDLQVAAHEMARKIAAAGPLATRGAKRIIGARLDVGVPLAADLADALRYALEWSEDVDESHAAQAEGRAPQFKGR